MSASFEASSNSIMFIAGLGCFCNDGCRFENLVHLDSGIMNKLGRGWSNNQTKVSLYLIFRGITALCGVSHWARILESNELKEEDICIWFNLC
jgi:hypothetical protein